MEIREDDLVGIEIRELLRAHLEHLRAVTPGGSVYAYDVARLRATDVTFWSAWDAQEILGCGALREISATAGEIKSMYTTPASRRRGVASGLLQHLLDEARTRGYDRVYLETGVTEPFAAARALYERHGFRATGPFAEYRDDPHSRFMVREI